MWIVHVLRGGNMKTRKNRHKGCKCDISQMSERYDYCTQHQIYKAKEGKFKIRIELGRRMLSRNTNLSDIKEKMTQIYKGESKI